MIKYWSKNCIEFIAKTDWAIEFLKVNNISEDEISSQKERLSKKDKK
jgi:hypothetical protein